MERVSRFVGKLPITILEASIEGAISGLLKCIPPKEVSLLIKHDCYIIESIFAARSRPLYESKNLTKEEIEKAERARAKIPWKQIDWLLERVRFLASQYSPEAVERKITPEWLMKKGEKRFPELIKEVEKNEYGWVWLENQTEELKLFVLGKIAWSNSAKRMVPIMPGAWNKEAEKIEQKEVSSTGQQTYR
jgi:hypothetical protein